MELNNGFKDDSACLANVPRKNSPILARRCLCLYTPGQGPRLVLQGRCYCLTIHEEPLLLAEHLSEHRTVKVKIDLCVCKRIAYRHLS